MASNIGAAVILVREDGKFLMQQRGRGCGIGMWSVPGGRKEPNEKCARTAIRETREEVGVHLLLVRHILTTHHPCPACDEVWQTEWYTTDRYIGEPHETDEAIRLFWADWEVMPAPIWDPFALNIRTLRECLSS